MSDLHVFATTFNLATFGPKISQHEVDQWLGPAVKNPQGVKSDIVVIGVQEIIDLDQSLSGLTTTLINTLTQKFLHSLSSPNDNDYYLLSSPSLCSISLWIFFNAQKIPAERLTRPSIARTGLGLGGMGNKGAVGVRVGVQRGGEEGNAWETFTFISAHLAAHDYALRIRNANYLTLLTSLLFPSSSSLEPPSTRLHQTSHLILLGDLNYRLSEDVRAIEKFGPHLGVEKDQRKFKGRWDGVLEGSLAQVTDGGDERAGGVTFDEALMRHRKELVEMDTLAIERGKNKTMLGLREGPLTSFAPTYKRVVGQQRGYDPKRRPGYTDRVLFASWDDELISGENDDEQEGSSRRGDHEGEGRRLIGKRVIGKTKAILYDSIPEIIISDHKPVYSLIHYPFSPQPPNSSIGSTPYQTPQLPFPYPLPPATDPLFLATYNGVGRGLDRVVGYAWMSTLVLGAGRVKIGIAVEVVLVTVLVCWLYGLF